jgi:hypothetical protein
MRFSTWVAEEYEELLSVMRKLPLIASTPMESHEQAWKSIEANDNPGQTCTDRLESFPRKRKNRD